MVIEVSMVNPFIVPVGNAFPLDQVIMTLVSSWYYPVINHLLDCPNNGLFVGIQRFRKYLSLMSFIAACLGRLYSFLGGVESGNWAF